MKGEREETDKTKKKINNIISNNVLMTSGKYLPRVVNGWTGDDDNDGKTVNTRYRSIIEYVRSRHEI